MALVLGPSGNLLYAPGGLANSTKCCCCEEECTECPCCTCFECADGVQYALPARDACADSMAASCFTLTLSGLTFVTACRTYRTSTCANADGTFDSYKMLSASLPADLVIPMVWNTGTKFPVRDPDSPCNDASNICVQWETCLTLQDTGVDATQYFANNCTGSGNTFNVTVAEAHVSYQVNATGTIRRFIVYVDVAIGSSIPIPIFFGAVNFDARQCANYSAWPLVVNNAASTSCACGASSRGIHAVASGGTATLALTCDHPGCEEGAGLAEANRLRHDADSAAESIAALNAADGNAMVLPERTSGPVIAAHRLADALAMDRAEALEAKKKRKRCCSG